jgi:hypothetical protein
MGVALTVIINRGCADFCGVGGYALLSSGVAVGGGVRCQCVSVVVVIQMLCLSIFLGKNFLRVYMHFTVPFFLLTCHVFLLIAFVI